MHAQTDALGTMARQDRSISEVFERERGGLRRFIRRYVPDLSDADDIFQEVFFEFVETARLLKPIEQAGAWLIRVARNRIYDRFRSKAVASPTFAAPGAAEEATEAAILDLLPAADLSPEAAFARQLLLEELTTALDELPEDQRSVFVAHELEGRSFKDIAAQTGVGINTLLSRKRYAVLALRRRLQAIYDEFL
jgi:RNA polymerase sigma factor (sigma-70 family)